MIYLDNAATSFPKPLTVRDEMCKCIQFYCGNPGRSSHALSMAAAEKIFECRETIADFLGLDSPEKIIFTLNTTYALNIAIKGVLRSGDHVLISDIEHNSVLRPVHHISESNNIKYDIFPSLVTYKDRSSDQICACIDKMLRPNTRMVVCTHSSNICSAVMPIKHISKLCHKRNIIFVVDAAQSAGHMPIDICNDGIDILCAPGHKGLLGPAGCGFLAINKNIALDTLIEGGNGVESLMKDMSSFIPERYEAGTTAVPALAGLNEGVKVVKQFGIENIHQYEQQLFDQAYERLSSIKKVEIYVPQERGSVMLFNVKNIPSDEVCQRLNQCGICARSGFHCAALAHKTLNTPESGAVRISFGVYNTTSDLDNLYDAIKTVCHY